MNEIMKIYKTFYSNYIEQVFEVCLGSIWERVFFNIRGLNNEQIRR